LPDWKRVRLAGRWISIAGFLELAGVNRFAERETATSERTPTVAEFSELGVFNRKPKLRSPFPRKIVNLLVCLHAWEFQINV
jgi:hypothetical protein